MIEETSANNCQEQPVKLIYSQSEYNRDLTGLINALNPIRHIRRVCAPSRGGLIVGVELSHGLGVDFMPFHAGCMCPSVRLVGEEIASGQIVVLVDDIIDSGMTLGRILKEWKDIPGYSRENVIIASLFYNPSQYFVRPNYYSRIVDRATDKRWVNFYWERNL